MWVEEAKEQKKEMCEVVAVLKLAVQSNKPRVVSEVKNVTSFEEQILLFIPFKIFQSILTV